MYLLIACLILETSKLELNFKIYNLIIRYQIIAKTLYGVKLSFFINKYKIFE